MEKRDLSQSEEMTLDGKYALTRLLGSGLQAKVYIGLPLDKAEGSARDINFSSEDGAKIREVAIKIFEDECFRKLAQQEFETMAQLKDHPNVVKVHSHVSRAVLLTKKAGDEKPQAKEVDYIVMDFHPNGDLFSLIKSTNKLERPLARRIFSELLDIVNLLHSSAGIVHLDLKLENILIGEDMHLKLCDFGFAQDSQKLITINKGTDGYKCPEFYKLNKGFSGVQADIFALGVILFIFAFAVPPFIIANNNDHYYRFLCRGKEYKKFFLRMHPSTRELYKEQKLDEELVELLLALLDDKPENRPQSIHEILNFAYMTNNEQLPEEVYRAEITQRIQTSATQDQSNLPINPEV